MKTKNLSCIETVKLILINLRYCEQSQGRETPINGFELSRSMLAHFSRRNGIQKRFISTLQREFYKKGWYLRCSPEQKLFLININSNAQWSSLPISPRLKQKVDLFDEDEKDFFNCDKSYIEEEYARLFLSPSSSSNPDIVEDDFFEWFLTEKD